MRITKDDQLILQIEEQHKGIILFAAVMLFFSVGRMGYLVFHHEMNIQQYIHWVIVGAISFFGGNAFSEKIIFQFDLYKKEIKWSRKKIMGKGEFGRIPFVDIIDVNITTTDGGQETKYRIELICKDGRIPISKVYSQGKREEYYQILNKIVKYIKF